MPSFTTALFMNHHCAVVGCSNDVQQLTQWKSKTCPLHKCNFGCNRCICDPPFCLFPFPTKHRDPDGHERWKKAVIQADPKQPYSLFETTNCMFVCSIHFVDGKPTTEHPDPTLGIGCDIKLNRTRYREKSYASSSSVALQNKTEVDAVFRKQKQSCLSKIDLSKKGSLDEAVADIVAFINQHDQYFTTSSCSGRIYIYEESDSKKKSCNWLYVTHDASDWKLMWESLRESRGDAFIKFEPFVLHVQCGNLVCAQLLHGAAIAAGFRNSGLSVGKHGKIITAVRSTHSLEVPVTCGGECLVSCEYVKHVSKLANRKLEENFQRIKRFYSCLLEALLKADTTLSPQPSTCSTEGSTATVLKLDRTDISAATEQDCTSSPVDALTVCEQAMDSTDNLNLA